MTTKKLTKLLALYLPYILLGLVATKDPKQIEFALKKIIPPDMGSDFCHRIVLFGRDICPARSPKCDRCPLADGTCRRVGVAAKK